MRMVAGSYTQNVSDGLTGDGKGISVFDFDEETGRLKFLFSKKNINTSYVAINKNLQLLYTFTEVLKVDAPQLLTYSIKDDDLELIHQTPINGGLPCHLNLLGKNNLAVACYETGNCLVYLLDVNGIPQQEIQNIQHSGSGPNKLRQEAPHAHQVVYDDESDVLLISDLGIDKVMAYEKKERFDLAYSVKVPESNGPRHIVIHTSQHFAFISNEMTGNITLCKKINNRFEAIQTTEAQSESLLGKPASASTIQLSSTGQFVYMGLRTGNQISICEFDEVSESIALKTHQSSLGITPRDFIISPCGKWLIVANQDSENIITFEINPINGSLQARAEITQQKSIVCLKFL